MANNLNLSKSKKMKNDEFYTRLCDIENVHAMKAVQSQINGCLFMILKITPRRQQGTHIGLMYHTWIWIHTKLLMRMLYGKF